MMSTEADFQNLKCYQQMRGLGLSYTDPFSFQNATILLRFHLQSTRKLNMIMKMQIFK